jgi:hypothetical protein
MLYLNTGKGYRSVRTLRYVPAVNHNNHVIPING